MRRTANHSSHRRAATASGGGGTFNRLPPQPHFKLPVRRGTRADVRVKNRRIANTSVPTLRRPAKAGAKGTNGVGLRGIRGLLERSDPEAHNGPTFTGRGRRPALESQRPLRPGPVQYLVIRLFLGRNQSPGTTSPSRASVRSSSAATATHAPCAARTRTSASLSHQCTSRRHDSHMRTFGSAVFRRLDHCLGHWT